MDCLIINFIRGVLNFMKKMKKILTLMVSLWIFSLASITVGATEIREMEDSIHDMPPTGTKLGYCTLSFNIGYLGEQFDDDIAVTFKDIATEKKYQFLLKADNGYNVNESYSIIANTTYNVTVDYVNMDSFEITNADGTPVEAYAATESGLILTWQIRERTEEEKAKVKNIPHGEDDSKQNSSLETESDGEKIVEVFTEETQFIELEDDFDNFIGNWSGAVYERLFLSIDGNLQKQWDEMTGYERACYSLLFLYPKSIILNINNSYDLTDKEDFMKNLDVAKIPLENLDNGDKVYRALVKAWEWHWENWVEKGRFINPYENIPFHRADRKKEERRTVLTVPDQEELPKEQIEIAAEEMRSNLASPRNFLDILKDEVFSITILIITGILVAVTAYRHKNRNYENSDDE